MDDATDSTARLGDYILIERLDAPPPLRRWLARQESVRRTVIIEELPPENMVEKDAFLADVRAKASVDHPAIGAVYEAVADGTRCFCALEALPGPTLADRSQAGEPMRPLRLAQGLRRIAEAQIYLEDRGFAADDLQPAAIHSDDTALVRLANQVRAGQRDPGLSARDIAMLGDRLRSLVADGHPGATRALTLLDWMRRGVDGVPLSWQAVRGYCEQIEQQLAGESPSVTPMTSAMVRPARRTGPWVAALCGILSVTAIFVFLRSGGGKKSKPAPKPELPSPVAIPAGNHPTPDGGKEKLDAFRLASHEVTIGEYAAFLEALEPHIAKGNGTIFDQPGQPADKRDHRPDDWDALLAAARGGSPWQGATVTIGTPVVGVDWWDAAAYAEWKKARLPTQEQWFAALRHGTDEPASLAPAPWQAVTAATTDRTRDGLLNMAGSVSEWMARPAIEPDNPAAGRKWVISGGSQRNPRHGALTREWTENRRLRRPDLGFRIVPSS